MAENIKVLGECESVVSIESINKVKDSLLDLYNPLNRKDYILIDH